MECESPAEFFAACYQLTLNCTQSSEKRNACISKCMAFLEEGSDPTVWNEHEVIHPFLCFAKAFALPLIKYTFEHIGSYQNKNLNVVLDRNGKNALHLCATTNPEEHIKKTLLEEYFGTVKFLVNHFGFSVTDKDNDGNTPVHLAIETKSLGAIQSFVFVFCENNKKRCPQQVTGLTKNDMIDQIIDAPIDHVQAFLPHCKNKHGNSLFLHAILYGIEDKYIYDTIYLIDDNSLTANETGHDAMFFLDNAPDLKNAVSAALESYEALRKNEKIKQLSSAIDKNSTLTHPLSFTYRNVFTVNDGNDLREFHDAGQGYVKLAKHQVRIANPMLKLPNGKFGKLLLVDICFNVSSSTISARDNVPTRVEICLGAKKNQPFEDFPFLLIEYDLLLQLNDQISSGNKTLDELKEDLTKIESEILKQSNEPNPDLETIEALTKQKATVSYAKDSAARLLNHRYYRIDPCPKPDNWQILTMNSTCSKIVVPKLSGDGSLFLASTAYEMEIKKLTDERELLASKNGDTTALDLAIEQKTKEYEEINKKMEASSFDYNLTGFILTLQASFAKIVAIENSLKN